MTIEWVFDPAGHSMTKFRDMEEGIVQPTSTMSSLEILARENEQNLVDHPADPTKPTLCTYEVRKLSGSDKKNFYAALHMDKYTPHLKGAIKPPIPGEPTTDKMSADTTDDLDILIIRHDNGVGLIGGEFPGEGIDEKNFHALVKSYGLNDKGADGGGGSHGVGKNVYWQWSKHGIVLFYSSLSKDYNGHTRRFIGTGRVKVTHRTVSGGTKFLPYGLLGTKATHEGIDACFSLYDDDADAIAKSLGLNVRSPSDPGTTIVIVGFKDPRDPNKDMTVAAMEAVGLQMASEKNWFPAKLSGALEVKYIDTAGGAPPQDWAPQGPNFQLLKWLDKGLDEEPGPTIKRLPGRPRKSFTTTYKRIPLNLEIPRDYPGNTTSNVLKSKAVLALMIVDDEEYDRENPELGDDVWGTTACIRHTGMVVTYKPFIQKPTKFYRGVLLVGKSVDQFDKKFRGTLNPVDQKLAEEMMKFSEPAVHDDWQPKNFTSYVSSNSLGEEYTKIADIGATKISIFLKQVELATREALGLLAPPKAKKNADFVELSKSLDLGSNNSDSGGRIIKIQSVKVEKTSHDKAKLSFEVKVPSSDPSNGWNSKTTHWYLRISPKLRWSNGKKENPRTVINCIDFDEFLDDGNNAKWKDIAQLNYVTARRAKWKPTTDALSVAMRTDEWSGEVNKLNEAPILDKEIHLSFSEVEIDLTGYENAILELVIEAGEVKA